MNVVRRYFLVHLTLAVGLLTLTVIGFITTLGISEELGDLGAQGWWRAIAIPLVRMPQTLHQSLPYAVIIGSAAAFVAMDKTREMTVLRTSGLTLRNMAAMVLQAGLLWSAVHLTASEALISPSAKLEKQLKLESGSSFLSSEDAVWIIDGSSYIRIDSISANGLELRDVTIFTIDPSGDLVSIREAGSAERDGDGWKLDDVWTTKRDSSWAGTATANAQWDADITPDLIESYTTKPHQMSAREMWTLIGFLEANGQWSRDFRIALWHKLATSLSIPLLMLTGLCFVTYQRSISVGGSIGVALLLALAYYLIVQIVHQLSVSAVWIPVPLVAAAPPLAWFGGVLAILRTRERR